MDNMIVSEHSLLILAVVLSMLSLIVNLVELTVMLTIRPILEKLIEAIAGVNAVNQQLLNQLAVIADRTARPND